MNKLIRELDKRLLEQLGYNFAGHPWSQGFPEDGGWYIVGSQYTVYPPPEENTDLDILVPDEIQFTNYIIENGFELCASEEYGNKEFTAYRKGLINIIVAHTEELFRSFYIASRVCRELNLKDKEQRVLIHEALRGNLVLWGGRRYNIINRNKPHVEEVDGAKLANLNRFRQLMDGAPIAQPGRHRNFFNGMQDAFGVPANRVGQVVEDRWDPVEPQQERVAQANNNARWRDMGDGRFQLVLNEDVGVAQAEQPVVTRDVGF